jgi:formylglycine-generating enzyme required for sulfatase activity
VTNGVVTTNSATFYRVVATSNSTVFVDGAYMSIDLSGGTGATSYAVSCYDSATAVPGGITNDAYKTTNLLMRLIPAGTFTMGSPVDELGRGQEMTQNQVTLTQSFYIGVFEVTQKQWELVMGNNPSYFTNAAYYAARPVEQVSYNMIRGASDGAGWPTNSHVDAASFMGRLRARTSKAFDLPTESQWEYAGRAGTTTALNSGKNLTDISQCPNMSEVGRYWYNGPVTYGYSQSVDTSGATAKAGTYLPNAWGLFDMHGNVDEWCLDWYPYDGSSHVWRGGSWAGLAKHCRVAVRTAYIPSYVTYRMGFRAALPPGQ